MAVTSDTDAAEVIGNAKDERPAVQNLVADSHTPHGHGHRRHYHDHMHEVVLPMRTGLHDWEVPYGLRLAGVTTGYRQVRRWGTVSGSACGRCGGGA